MEILSQSCLEEFTNSNSIRHKSANPPKDAYLFFPKGNDVIEWDSNNPKKTMRRIFESGSQYNEFEQSILTDFQTQKEKYNTKNKIQLNFPSDWKEYSTLRFIQATGYDINKSIEILINHIKWRQENLPIIPSDHIKEILNLGFIYGHGRDSKFRPIYIINAEAYKSHSSKYTANEWIYSLVYFLEYMIKNTLISGQVENWNIICDVANVSIFFVPKDFNTLLSVLQNNYRCRLYMMFIMNVSTAVYWFWKTIKNLLDPNTEKKIKILGKNDFSEIFKFVNLEQVEEKYGGTAVDLEEHFFPPYMPSQNFIMDNEKKEDVLISEEKYQEMLKSGNCNLAPRPIDQNDEECKNLFKINFSIEI